MKIALINTSEKIGGAAVACNRLMKALNKSGHEACMLVRDKQTDDEQVISVNTSWFAQKKNVLRFAWERLIIFLQNGLTRKNLFAVSIANTGVDISDHPVVKEADIIHLHWVNQGMLSLKGIRKLIQTGKPIVWTLHDMWPITGVCHHSWECLKFHQFCGTCPFVKYPKQNDVSRKIWCKKKNVYDIKQMTLIAVSRWLKDQIDISSLSKGVSTKVIPNVIDTDFFVPLNKSMLRKKQNLPVDKKIILFAAAKINDPIKGFHFLCEAMRILIKENQPDSFFILILGNIKGDISILSQLSCPYKFYGTLNDINSIRDLFAAADVVLNSSYYETFGQTLIEAMSCGAIPVAFNNSGVKDIIDHKINGYLAKYKSAEDLANGIRWILFDADYEVLSKNARKKVELNYSENVIAQQYLDVYSELMAKR